MALTRVVRKTPPSNADDAVDILDIFSDRFAAMGFFMHHDHIDAVQASKYTITSHDVTFTAVSTDAGAIARANALKVAFNAHAAEANYTHEAADATNAPSATADCTDVATCTTLLLDLKAKINAHVIFATPHRGLPGWSDQAAITPSDAASNITSCNELLKIWKRHVNAAFPDIERVGV